MPEHLQVIVDPFLELQQERARHHATLMLVKQFIDRGVLLNATARPSRERCKLCDKVPASDGMSYRRTCPHIEGPLVLASNLQRLGQKIERNRPTRKADSGELAEARA